VTCARNLVITGLGGSRRYKPRGRHQYTENEMHLRMIPLLPRLLWRRLRTGRGADILVTHAPPRGVHDAADAAHIGFEAFHRLIRAVRPRLLLHGHMHRWTGSEPRESEVDGTRVLNVYPVSLIEIEADR
jgi:Icc-related predicted phosphoesterase